jgi:hypothetical protein
MLAENTEISINSNRLSKQESDITHTNNKINQIINRYFEFTNLLDKSKRDNYYQNLLHRYYVEKIKVNCELDVQTFLNKLNTIEMDSCRIVIDFAALDSLVSKK